MTVLSSVEATHIFDTHCVGGLAAIEGCNMGSDARPDSTAAPEAQATLPTVRAAHRPRRVAIVGLELTRIGAGQTQSSTLGQETRDWLAKFV